MNQSYQYYLKILLSTILITITFIGLFNFIYDPGEIYLKKIMNDKYVDDYTNLLLKSNIGMPFFPNERLVKLNLAKKSIRQSYVIGSSHVMQCSTVSKPSSIESLTGELTNLAVSGGSFEDLTVFSGTLLDKGTVKKVVYGIDPWTLKYNMDARWGQYSNQYSYYAGRFGFKAPAYESYYLKAAKNLVNREYLKQSWKTAKNDKFSFIPKNQFEAYMNPILELDTWEGAKVTATLNDGSHVYSADYISQLAAAPLGNGSYKIEGQYVDPEVVQAFRTIIEAMRQNGIEVYILMTPYHPRVFEKDNELISNHILTVEKIVREFAADNNIKCFGSYNSSETGFARDDFLDDMHLKRQALNKMSYQ